MAEPIAPRTWLGVGGKAEFFAEPRTISELGQLLRRASDLGVQHRILGDGANLLVRDQGVSGLVVHLSAPAFQELAVSGTRVIAGGGLLMPRLITRTTHAGLAGLEVMAGIPGTVGGIIRCNAGGRDGDIAQWVVEVVTLDNTGAVRRFDHRDLCFGYRYSNLDGHIIVSATFDLYPESPSVLQQRVKDRIAEKKGSQPLAAASAGCIFKNPRNISARMVMQRSGVSGARVRGAEVSDLHPNFIVTHPSATAQDVLDLAEHIRHTVADRMHINLEFEVEVW